MATRKLKGPSPGDMTFVAGDVEFTLHHKVGTAAEVKSAEMGFVSPSFDLNFSGSFFESLIKRLDKIERRLARIEKKLPGEK